MINHLIDHSVDRLIYHLIDHLTDNLVDRLINQICRSINQFIDHLVDYLNCVVIDCFLMSCCINRFILICAFICAFISSWNLPVAFKTFIYLFKWMKLAHLIRNSFNPVLFFQNSNFLTKVCTTLFGYPRCFIKYFFVLKCFGTLLPATTFVQSTIESDYHSAYLTSNSAVCQSKFQMILLGLNHS